MSVANFLKHLQAPAPAFNCYASGEKSKKLAHVAKVTHTLKPPAAAASLDMLKEQLGSKAGDFIKLYSAHDGGTLYRDTLRDPDGDRAEGLQFYPLATWAKRTKQMIKDLQDMGMEPDEYPAGVEDALAFAEIPHSGNKFTVKLSKPDHGAIFYADHDGASGEPFAKSLGEFLQRIVADPAQFLYDVGCYTRYSDGKTDTQWIPKEFQAEIK